MDVIFDMDGTLCDLTHRRHYIEAKPKNWDAFFATAGDDAPVEPIIGLCHRFSLTDRIIICSGRPERLRATTEQWLDQYVWSDDKRRISLVKHVRLYMRRDGDYRADDIVKGELLDQIISDGFDPKLVFDDRDRVVAMWRSRGLTCCQVATGNF